MSRVDPLNFNVIDLIVNLALLVALSNISGFIRQTWEKSRVGALWQGLLFGSIAILGMLRPMAFLPGVFFDGRSVVMSLCGLFFGPLAGAVACGIALIFRMSLGGTGALTGCAVLVASLLLGLAMRGYLARKNVGASWKHFLWLGFFVQATMLSLMLTLPSGMGILVIQSIGLFVLFFYSLVTVLIGKILSSHLDATQILENIRASEELHRSIMDASPDNITITDLDGRILMVSLAGVRMFGFDHSKALLDRMIFDLLDPVDDGKARASWEMMAQGVGSFAGHYRFLSRDGGVFSAEVTARFIRDSQGLPVRVVVILRDITRRLTAEEAKRQAEELMTQFIRNSPIFVYIKEVTETESRVLHLSRNFIEMTGISAKDMVGKRMDELFPADFAAKMTREDQDVVAKGEILELDEELNGRYYTTIKFPIRFEDHVYLAGYTIDITDRKRLAEERLQLEARLAQAQKMEGMGSLAGGVAHDMNNVLGAIMALASANLELVPEGSPVRGAFETILKASERGGKMVRSLLSFARQSLAEERVLDLNVILREEVSLLERVTLAKVHLVLDLAQDLHSVQGDPGALSHAFMNLCVNAVDAMGEGGTLTLRTRNLEGAWVEARVEDSGHGMSRDVLKKAMDPFFTTKVQGKGTGLGLALVYSTVKAHHGQIFLESEPGRGTSVILRFPVFAGTGALEDKPAEPQIRQASASMRVLLVDDDELILSSITSILSVLGHHVSTASSGEKALEALDVDGQAVCAQGFDVVILDLNMPGLGGADTLSLLRKRHPDLPVLLATGRADQRALDLVGRYSKVTLLAKPYGMAELRLQLEAATSGKALPSPE